MQWNHHAIEYAGQKKRLSDKDSLHFIYELNWS